MSFCGVVRHTAELGELPPEDHARDHAQRAHAARSWFHRAFSAASAKLRLDVAVRNQIAAGRIPGLRLRAASPEITVTGGLGDNDRLHLAQSSFGLVVDGPLAMARGAVVRSRGRDTIKINLSGDFCLAAAEERTVMREDEARMAWRSGARPARSRRTCARVQCYERMPAASTIYHCEYADVSALDALGGRARPHSWVSAIGVIHNTLYEAEAYGIDRNTAREIGIVSAVWRTRRTGTSRCASAASAP